MSSTGNGVAVVGRPNFTDRDVDDVIEGIQVEAEGAKKKTKEEKARDAIMALLKRLGSMTVKDDSIKFEGSQWVIPATYAGHDGWHRMMQFLQDHHDQQRQPFEYNRTMSYRPHDGAYAFMQVMKELTGTEGFGTSSFSFFFGVQHPQMIDIDIDYGVTAQVPWGQISFPMFEATFTLGQRKDKEKGLLFHLECEAPKQYRQPIEAIFALIQEFLKEHSIYRGKAVTGAETPEFVRFDERELAKIVYSEEVFEQLEANVWVPIMYAEDMRREQLSLKRAVVFSGSYGTGKTSGGRLTMKKAVDHGWTAIVCRPGKDDPADVLRTAQLYAPCVVVIEDVDVYTNPENQDAMSISEMLDMLDGITNKGVEIITLFTTNHPDKIHKGVLRPGRIDAFIEIEELDQAGFQRVVENTLGTRLADDIDWALVEESFKGFFPAFAVEAASRAQRFTMAKMKGKPGVVTTAHLQRAAKSLRPQLDRMAGAKEDPARVRMEDLMEDVVVDVLSRTRIYDDIDQNFVVADREDAEK